MKMNETHTQRKRKSYQPAIMLVAMLALLAGGCAETKSSPRFDLDAGADADTLGDGGEEPITFDPLDTYYRVAGESGLISERLEELAEDESLEVRICEWESSFSTTPADLECTVLTDEWLYIRVGTPNEDGPERVNRQVLSRYMHPSWAGLPFEWFYEGRSGLVIFQVWSRAEAEPQLLYEMHVMNFTYTESNFDAIDFEGDPLLFRIPDVRSLGLYEIVCPTGYYITRTEREDHEARFSELGTLADRGYKPFGNSCVPIPDDFQP